MKKEEVAKQNPKNNSGSSAPRCPQTTPLWKMARAGQSASYWFSSLQQGKCNSSDASLIMKEGKYLFKRGFLGRTRWAGTRRWILTWASARHLLRSNRLAEIFGVHQLFVLHLPDCAAGGDWCSMEISGVSSTTSACSLHNMDPQYPEA